MSQQEHQWKALKCIIHYLAGTIHHCLLLLHNSSSSLVLWFSNIGWFSSLDDRKL